jgi:Outer membrane protein beta-barrel domain
MPRLIASMLLAIAVLAPASARADGFVSPYIGVNFGGDTTKKSTAIGGALGVLGKSAGFEVDFNYTPDFFGDDTLDVDGKVVTLMGNLLIGGRHHAVSPYFAVGAGLIRTDVNVFSDVVDFSNAKNSVGGNIGGGLFAGSGPVTVRGDVRYYRAFDVDDFPSRVLEGDKLGFWRANIGIGFMW